MSMHWTVAFRSRRACRAGLLTALMLGAAASVVPAAAIETTHMTVSGASRGVPRHVSLGVNKSMIVDLPADAREVIVSQPAIASVTMRTKRRAVVQGTGVGDTNIFFLDAAGNQIAVIDVATGDDAGGLQQTIAQLVPGSHIRVERFNDHVVLSGTALSGDDVDRAMVIATQFTGDASKVGNVITVGGPQQVMLRVEVAEVKREAIKQLGLDLSATLSGGLTTSLVNNPVMGNISGGAPSGSITAGFSAGPLTVSATLKALERRNAVRTLAEPTLTAMSGQPAEFLAGGQFPYTSVDGNGNPVTAFKNFGVQLSFTPTVKSDGRINLLVDTSVSEPISGGALSERHAKTTVEMPTGTTLAIGGMLQDTAKQEFNAFPGLGDIPIIGALFRSRDFIHDRTELVILVTPYIAEPVAGPVATPVDDFVLPSDAEAIFLGHLQKLYGVGDPHHAASLQYRGSVGFSLE